MKPSEKMIEAVKRSLVASEDLFFSEQATRAIETFLTAARAEGWVLCHQDEEISEGMALVGQHTCSEWLNDHAPIGEAMYRSPALATFKDMLRAKLAEEW